MREILFRGKRKDTGEWVYGDLVRSYLKIGGNACITDFAKGIVYGVDNETVGQYTGLTDKNGTKVFEGDILRVDDSDCFGNDRTGTVLVDDMTDAPTMVGLHFAHEIEVIGNIHEGGEWLWLSTSKSYI